MSRENTSNKKRRLESEQSQVSGITNLSNVTQTTELSSDFEDSNSDSSLNNKNSVFNESRSNVTNDVIMQGNNPRSRNGKRPPRKRQVSWSLDCDDEDETFLKESFLPEKQGQPKPVAFYDNNFTGTNNSLRRTRRATESSIDNHALSYLQPQSPFNGPGVHTNHHFGGTPLRSNTTSQIHGHENEIQRQRMAELIREHDAKVMKQQRRSQSVTSLRADSTQTQIGSHMYESLQQRRVGNNRPVDTVVTMTNPDRNYLHPTTETFVQGNNRSESFSRLNNINGIPSDCSSGYADVIRYSESSKASQHQTPCFYNCNISFYRKGFFVLLVLNVILILLNAVGLPFLYVAIRHDDTSEQEGKVGAQMTEVCFKCDKLLVAAEKELTASGVIVKDKNLCCVKSAEQLLPAILKVINLPQPEKMDNVPVVQLKAASISKEDNAIVWEKREEINKMEAEIENGTTIKIKKTGYYYVFSRVHYERNETINPKHRPPEQMFTIGHSVIKKTGNDVNGNPIDKIVQRCFPSNSTKDIRHTNHLGSVQHLLKGDRLSIRLDHRKYFDHENSMFGMFLVAT